jgi:hypothetical protein
LPWQYVFEGWHAQRSKWIVLVEHAQISEHFPAEACRLDPIDTEFEFAKFRFRPTEWNIPAWGHITVGAMEIHGSVRVTGPIVPVVGEEDCSLEDFDPWAIPDMEWVRIVTSDEIKVCVRTF